MTYKHLQHQLMPQPVVKNYVSESDEIVLEDEVQRIQLIGNIGISKLVTGKEETLCTLYSL